MKIDIRNNDLNVNQIDFASENISFSGPRLNKAFTICKGNNEGQIDLCDSHKYVSINGRDVDNLIKALQKAMELGWTE